MHYIHCYDNYSYTTTILLLLFNPLAHAWRQKIAILIWMQFLNDIIKLEYGFKTAQNFYKF